MQLVAKYNFPGLAPDIDVIDAESRAHRSQELALFCLDSLNYLGGISVRCVLRRWGLKQVLNFTIGRFFRLRILRAIDLSVDGEQ